MAAGPFELLRLAARLDGYTGNTYWATVSSHSCFLSQTHLHRVGSAQRGYANPHNDNAGLSRLNFKSKASINWSDSLPNWTHSPPEKMKMELKKDPPTSKTQANKTINVRC